MNKELNQKITQTENKITNTKSALKVWANQISQYYKTLKALSQQLEAIKEKNMKQNNNNDNINPKGETK